MQPGSESSAITSLRRIEGSKRRGGVVPRDWRLLVGLLVLAIFTFYPFVFLLMSSFKDPDQFMHSFWLPAFPPHLDNYLLAAQVTLPYLKNSLIVTLASLVGVVLLSTVSAYVFARYPFPGREIFFMAVIVLLMVPGVLMLIPQFLLSKQLGLLNTYWALILFAIANGQVFGIFIMRSFFATLPKELFEAARIDGASEIDAFIHIAVPLSSAIMVTIAILDTITTWNDYIWPLVVLQDEAIKTFPLGLINFQNALRVNYGVQFAAYVIASLPLIVLLMFTMRYFVRGLTSGAIRA